MTDNYFNFYPDEVNKRIRISIGQWLKSEVCKMMKQKGNKVIINKRNRFLMCDKFKKDNPYLVKELNEDYSPSWEYTDSDIAHFIDLMIPKHYYKVLKDIGYTNSHYKTIKSIGGLEFYFIENYEIDKKRYEESLEFFKSLPKQYKEDESNEVMAIE